MFIFFIFGGYFPLLTSFWPIPEWHVSSPADSWDTNITFGRKCTQRSWRTGLICHWLPVACTWKRQPAEENQDGGSAGPSVCYPNSRLQRDNAGFPVWVSMWFREIAGKRGKETTWLGELSTALTISARNRSKGTNSLNLINHLSVGNFRWSPF